MSSPESPSSSSSSSLPPPLHFCQSYTATTRWHSPTRSCKQKNTSSRQIVMIIWWSWWWEAPADGGAGHTFDDKASNQGREMLKHILSPSWSFSLSRSPPYNINVIWEILINCIKHWSDLSYHRLKRASENDQINSLTPRLQCCQYDDRGDDD